MAKLLDLAGKVKEEAKDTGFSFGKIGEILKEKINKNLESTNEVFAKIVDQGVKGLSKGLAEAIVLGKDFNETMKKLAQTILVNVMARLIEEIILLGIKKIFLEDETTQATLKLGVMQKQESSLKRQIALQAVLMALGGGGGGFLGFAKGGAVSKGRPIVVGENGPEMFVPNSTGQITQSARGTSGGGSTNVNFTINATDVRGVKELLIDNRATIVNVINSALNEKGKEALV
jgi:hypothetical protein